MKVALRTKLKCAGPLRDFDTEVQRFLYWLPPQLRPLVVKGRSWQRCYRQASGVEAQLEIERRGLQDLRRLQVNLPEQSLIHEFLERAEQARRRSVEARHAALAGKAIDGQLDDTLIDGLLRWLAEHPEHSEVADWLSRMVRAWWNERHPSRSGLSEQ